nr:hypothetical protein GCM10020093_088560 [Planobispora longispora]
MTQLRRALQGADEELIAAVPPGYQLRSDAVTVDLGLAEDLVRAGQLARKQDDAGTAAEHLRAALDLWRGETLSGLASETMAAEASKLEEWRLTVTEEYIDLKLAQGLGSEVITELTALVGHHPFRETLRAALMRALYGAGRQAEALEVYREGRAILAEELGVDPGPELRAAHDAILQGEPAAPAPRRPARTLPGHRPAPVEHRRVRRPRAGAGHDGPDLRRVPGRRGADLHRGDQHGRGREDGPGHTLGPPGGRALPRRAALHRPARLHRAGQPAHAGGRPRPVPAGARRPR